VVPQPLLQLQVLLLLLLAQGYVLQAALELLLLPLQHLLQ
jgi:hypothetical protein